MKNELNELINGLKAKYISIVGGFDFTNIMNENLADLYQEYGEAIINGNDQDVFFIMLEEFRKNIEKEFQSYQ